MRTAFVRALAVVASAVCMVGYAASPPAEWEGLELRKVKGLDAVYIRPNTQFAPYKKVLLDPAEVEFSKQWVRDNTRATPFSVEGKKINATMRLGKNCFSWINHHPQLKNLCVV